MYNLDLLKGGKYALPTYISPEFDHYDLRVGSGLCPSNSFPDAHIYIYSDPSVYAHAYYNAYTYAHSNVNAYSYKRTHSNSRIYI